MPPPLRPLTLPASPGPSNNRNPCSHVAQSVIRRRGLVCGSAPESFANHQSLTPLALTKAFLERKEKKGERPPTCCLSHKVQACQASSPNVSLHRSIFFPFLPDVCVEILRPSAWRTTTIGGGYDGPSPGTRQSFCDQYYAMLAINDICRRRDKPEDWASCQITNQRAKMVSGYFWQEKGALVGGCWPRSSATDGQLTVFCQACLEWTPLFASRRMSMDRAEPLHSKEIR
ncbi:hypothetical protein B0T21DRAFT_23849 [Apiosordaria backusii]|uniref:Uncharacterized protein n=1 Tax=Apiosordaria backusii TaxID=314023 RepID=A0AA40K778_9PEZI|nr:hypothetical protein B0T21DRAFT_23849 [Apiosordaria backusii]